MNDSRVRRRYRGLTQIAIAVVVGALALWCQHVILPISTPFWGLFNYQLDLDVYRQGARTVWDGGNLYDAKLLGQMDYTYAPISVVVLSPFAFMSLEVARIVWSVGIFVALYAVIVLSFRALGRPITWGVRALAIALVAVALLLEPVRTTVWYGQINVFLMLLILADLLRPDGSRIKGVGAGIAAGIKLTPLIFLLYYALGRRWRALAGVVAGFVLTGVVGFVVLPRESWAYWTGKLFDSDRVGAPQTLGNQSLRGLIANTMHTDAPNTALWLALVIAASALGLWAAQVAHRAGHELLALSIIGMLACEISPMSWGHHWVWFVPILVILVDLIGSSGLSWWRRALAGVGLILLMLTAFSWRTHYSYPFWFVNRAVTDGYFMGLFFKSGPTWAQWFVVFPYNAIFVVSAVVTLVVLRPRVGAGAGGPRQGVGVRR